MNKSEFDEIQANLIKKSLEQNEREVIVPPERRKGDDGVLKFINLMSFWLWGALFIVLAIITKAGRSVAYIQENQLLWLPLRFWRANLLKISLVVTIVCMCVCTMSIILNFARHRRKTDRIKRSLILCEVISFILGIFSILKLY